MLATFVLLLSIIAGFETVLTAGSGLDDNQWHTLHILRSLSSQVITGYKQLTGFSPIFNHHFCYKSDWGITI